MKQIGPAVIKFPPDKNYIIKKPDTVGLFEQVYRSTLQAEAVVSTPVEHFFSLNGQTFCLRFAGPALIPLLTPALAHLAIEPVDDPDLTIHAWDTASTGIPWPEPQWLGDMIPVDYNLKSVDRLYNRRGDIRGYSDARIHTCTGEDVYTLFDADRSLAILWCKDGASLPIYEICSPFRSILHWWVRQAGCQLIHAGAVGYPEGGVLLAGKGGSGKSTTALTCLHPALKSNLRYVSDDYSIAALTPDPYVFSTYSTGKVCADNLHRVDYLRHAIANPDSLDQEKALIFLQQYYKEKLIAGFPIRAILLPRVTEQADSWLSHATEREALGAILFSTLYQLVGTGQETVRFVQALVRSLPCFYLNLGTDLMQIPGLIEQLLAELLADLPLNEKRDISMTKIIL